MEKRDWLPGRSLISILYPVGQLLMALRSIARVLRTFSSRCTPRDLVADKQRRLRCFRR